MTNEHRYADLFHAEARERLVEMNGALLAIERGAGVDRVSELFRAVHNMKGMAAAMGYESIRDLSHNLEALLETVRSSETAPSPAMILTLFDAVDALERATAVQREEPKRSIRVDVERLDALMTLIGELVIARRQLTELAQRSGQQDLMDVMSHASGLISSLRDEITRSRMVPVGQAFERFERLVRDTSRDVGKQVAFELRGTDIEVDKSVLDEIGDPLIHLLRNALDHGIETAAERRIAGKPPVARLVLSTSRERSLVVIEVSDDGRGIDGKKVAALARAAGLLSPAQNELSASEILELISRPGFSTTAGVTRLSGRGVGLDVVATKVRALGGSMELATTPGKGTTISIGLPVTIAIIHALLAKTAGEVYALPIAHVVETIVWTPAMARSREGREAISIRGEELPVTRLRARLGQPPRESGAGHVVVLDLDKRRTSLVVDELLGQQEIVVKSFQAARGMPQIFSGATILSNGTPALILDARAVA